MKNDVDVVATVMAVIFVSVGLGVVGHLQLQRLIENDVVEVKSEE